MGRCSYSTMSMSLMSSPRAGRKEDPSKETSRPDICTVEAFSTRNRSRLFRLSIRHLKEHGIVPRSDILFLAESDEGVEAAMGLAMAAVAPAGVVRGVTAVFQQRRASKVIVRDVRFWESRPSRLDVPGRSSSLPTRNPLKSLRRVGLGFTRRSSNRILRWSRDFACSRTSFIRR
jgi:hypothetical protein